MPSQAGGVANFSDAADLLTKAVAHDPNFFLAYCQLAFVHDLIRTFVPRRDRPHARAFGPGKVGHRFCISVKAGFGRSAPGVGLASLLGIFRL